MKNEKVENLDLVKFLARFCDKCDFMTKEIVRAGVDDASKIEYLRCAIAAHTAFEWFNESAKSVLADLVAACEKVGYKDGGTAACCQAEHELYVVLYRAKELLK